MRHRVRRAVGSRWAMVRLLALAAVVPEDLSLSVFPDLIAES